MTFSLLDTIERYVTPRKSTNKQWNAPCMFCGGKDRLCIFPYPTQSRKTDEEIPPHVWCRQCNYWGTAEMLLRDKEKISLSDARAIIAGSKNLNETTPCYQRKKAVTFTPAGIDGSPWEEWQNCGKGFCRGCKVVLWSPAGEKALTWLRARGFSDEMIMRASLGYNPQDHFYACPQEWGLTEKLWLPRGIVIPYTGESQLWKIEIRLPVEVKGKQRYHMVKGSSNALYGYEYLENQGKSVLCEGVFDALAMRQVLEETGLSGIVVVATGSTDSAHEKRWLMRLGLCEGVVVAYDADEAGDKAARWWMDLLGNAKRWKPSHKDINEMLLEDKARLIDAAQCGFPCGLKGEMALDISSSPNACHICLQTWQITDIYGFHWCSEHGPKEIPETFEEFEDFCIECGEEVGFYDVYGRAWCAEHMPTLANPANIITTELTNPTEQPLVPVQEHKNEPIPIKRERKQKPKLAGMCSTDQCYGVGDLADVLGGLWCGNCKLRRELVDGMAALDFPRLEYSPGHFIEPRAEAVRDFARTMSPVAISLAIKEMTRTAGEIEVSSPAKAKIG